MGDPITALWVFSGLLLGLVCATGAAALWLRDQRRLKSLPRARSGTVFADGFIAFDDGALPIRLPVRGRVKPGPALVVAPAEDGSVRVINGLRGEVLAKLRARASLRRSVALASLAASLAPAAGLLV